MKRFEADDPLELVGVSFAEPMPAEVEDEMARVIVEEFALSGFTASEVAELFDSPLYTLPYRIRRHRGAAYVRSLIDGAYRGGT